MCPITLKNEIYSAVTFRRPILNVKYTTENTKKIYIIYLNIRIIHVYYSVILTLNLANGDRANAVCSTLIKTIQGDRQIANVAIGKST